MAKREVIDAEVVEEGEELAIVRSVSSELQTNLISSLGVFVKNVKVLEERALTIEKKAARLPKKITKKSADTAKAIVREARVAKRDVPETWMMLKKVQSLAKAMIAKRKISEGAFDAAIKAGESHYFEWSESEKRRIAEEQETARRAAEERARQEREKELVDIEQAALEAEAGMAELSDRELVFVGDMAGGMDLSTAASDAGYANPAKQGKRLMATKKIVQAIEAKREANTIREEAAVVNSAPLEVELDETESVDLKEGRRNRSAELLDEDALRAAVIEGKHGIPPEVLMANPVALNSYARDLGKLINRWPGVRLKIKRSLV